MSSYLDHYGTVPVCVPGMEHQFGWRFEVCLMHSWRADLKQRLTWLYEKPFHRMTSREAQEDLRRWNHLGLDRPPD
jgi:hypothetical protein